MFKLVELTEKQSSYLNRNGFDNLNDTVQVWYNKLTGEVMWLDDVTDEASAYLLSKTITAMKKQKIMNNEEHSHSCPHKCPACTVPTSRFNKKIWENNGCPICNKPDRGGTIFACGECYYKLSLEDFKQLHHELGTNKYS